VFHQECSDASGRVTYVVDKRENNNDFDMWLLSTFQSAGSGKKLTSSKQITVVINYRTQKLSFKIDEYEYKSISITV
jgi:hypothetical protein